MIYAEYPGYTKTYVICRGEGFGVAEAPYIQKEVVFETDSFEEANNKREELIKSNNTEEDLKSSWVPNTYWVNVNTLSAIGKSLEAEFEKTYFSKEAIKKLDESGEYDKFQVGEYTFRTKKNPLF